MATLEEQLRNLERQLSRVKPEKVIHNTPDAVSRMNRVHRESSWRGREIALDQEEMKL